MSKQLAHAVIRAFQDKYTLRHYAVGSAYQNDDDDRIAELQSLGFLACSEETEPTQDEDTDDPAPGLDKDSQDPPAGSPGDTTDEDRLKHVGGGYFLLPNGEKVRGKDEALEALKALDEAAKVSPDAAE
ncbi:hypothetical protein [Paenibacillus sedimenti]|uniref:Uncharacterized protein n=1 Tax=Paenibacillus sedimenti TaxID=2770274 RepID=A0A926KSM5_9BACL|nr:hypothetical protein [Paenibacillus sedimenti]MBD0381290.1 hypothetical protein [Paenibacillus sedimenti]